MAAHLLASAALGLAGVDLLGALVLLTLLALGAPARRTTALFLGLATAVTLAVGSLLAVLGRPLLAWLLARTGAPSAGVLAGVLIALALLAAGWAAWRWRRGHPVVRVPDALTNLVAAGEAGPPATRTVAAVAVLVGLAPPGDPAFLAAVAAGAARGHPGEILAGLLVFVAVSQAAVFAVGGAVLAGGDAAVGRVRDRLLGARDGVRDVGTRGADGRHRTDVARSADGRRAPDGSRGPSRPAPLAGRVVTASLALSALAFGALAAAVLAGAA